MDLAPAQLPPPPPEPARHFRKRTVVLATGLGIFGLLALAGLTVVGRSVADDHAAAQEYAEFVCGQLDGVAEHESNVLDGMYPATPVHDPVEAQQSVAAGLEEMQRALEGYAQVAEDAPAETDATRDARAGLQEMARIGLEVNEAMILGLDSLVPTSSMAAFDSGLQQLSAAAVRPRLDEFQQAAEQAEGEGEVARALDRDCADIQVPGAEWGS